MVEQSFRDEIPQILSRRVFAVVGASRNPEKYGYKVYKSLKRAGYTTYAVNPNADDIDGDPVYPLLDNIPEPIDCVVTVVPPEITQVIMTQAGHLRIPFCWMQPGSESEAAVKEAMGQGILPIYGGPCIMVAVATHSHVQEQTQEPAGDEPHHTVRQWSTCTPRVLGKGSSCGNDGDD